MQMVANPAGAGERGLAWMSSLYGLPARSFERHLVTGSARACASALARFAQAGAQHIAVFVTTDDPLVAIASFPCRAVVGRSLVGSVITVLHPLPYIAENVIEAERIGCERADWRGLFVVPLATARKAVSHHLAVHLDFVAP